MLINKLKLFRTTKIKFNFEIGVYSFLQYKCVQKCASGRYRTTATPAPPFRRDAVVVDGARGRN